MRRLFVHIYLTLLASLAALTLLFWLTRELFEGSHEPPWLELTVSVLTAALPGPDRPIDELRQSLARFADAARIPLSFYGADGQLLASTPEVVELSPYRSTTHWMDHDSVALRLLDGRWLAARPRHTHTWHVLAGLLSLGLVIALVSYPAVRQLTRRLERLRQRVEAVGEGDLSTPVAVEGNDEVAALARSFNRAIERIRGLLQAQRDLLANASHELRSPLTRLSLAFELLDSEERQDLKEQVHRDIAELDDLIDELLLSSRLQAVTTDIRQDSVDLVALAHEEAALVGANVESAALQVRGDAKLLRRLLRNLLENARRYGGDGPIDVRLRWGSERTVLLEVEDHGPGIPREERERVFEPFYRRAGMAESGYGAGLGLALVRQIARRHGGEARYLETASTGSCFQVVLANRISPD